MELKEALNTLDRIQRKEIAYMHAMGLLSYDGSTGAPEGTAQNRGETLGVLSEAAYALTTGKDTRQTLACLKDHWEELDDVTRRIVERKEKDLAELPAGNAVAVGKRSHVDWNSFVSGQVFNRNRE